MNTTLLRFSILKNWGVRPVSGALAFLGLMVAAPVGLQAQPTGKNPVGKIYVARVDGPAQIASGDRVEVLVLKGIFVAQGRRIETKPRGTVAMVFSNGTGIFLDRDTRITVKRFAQEPFLPSRTDLEKEPSVSQTEVEVSHGTLAVSTGKMAAGSTMTYLTPLGSINLRGGNLVVEIGDGGVKISLLAGEGVVRGGELDLGGRVLQAGEQAVIRPGAPGEPNHMEIRKILAVELPALEDKVAMAYAARKTVFFSTDGNGEITAVPVVAANLPVQATVSPSQLPK